MLTTPHYYLETLRNYEKLQVSMYELQQVLTPSVDNILIHGEHSQNANNFVYLESSIPKVNRDIEKRIALALSPFGRLGKFLWSNENILLKLKI